MARKKSGKKDISKIKLFSFIAKNKKVIIIMFSMILAGISIGQIVSKINGMIASSLNAGDSMSYLIMLACFIFGALLTETTVRMVSAKFLGKIGNNIAHEIRLEALSKILKTPLSSLEEKPVGSFVIQMTTYANEVGVFFGEHLSNIAIYSVRLAAIVAFMLSVNPLITLMILGFMIVIFLFINLFGKLIKKRNAIYKEMETKRSELIFETINGHKTILAYNRKNKNCEMFGSIGEKCSSRFVKYAKFNEFMNPMIDILWNIGLVSIYLFSFFLVQKGFSQDIGLIVALLGYMADAAVPISGIGVVIRNLAVAYSALDKIYETEVVELFNVPSENEIYLDAPEILLENVSYLNKSNNEVLKKVNLFIPYGEKLLITGHARSGKDTLAKIISGLYSPTRGNALIGGISINMFGRNLTDYVGIITAECFILQDTLLENIRVGNFSATDEECLTAARIAGLDKIAAKLEFGYNTMLYGEGEVLSEGEKMLVSFARTVLQNPKIIVVSDATTQMDSRQENKFYKMLSGIQRDKTIILIDIAAQEGFSYTRHINIEDGVIETIEINN